MTSDNRPPERTSRIALTRRIVAAGTMFGLLGWIGASSIRPRDSVSEAEAAILATLRHHASASQIGRLALASWPEMRKRIGLLTQILDDLELDFTAATQTSANELGRRLSQRIQTDFTVGRTVRLDGWLLSLAEVRLCALAALNNVRMAS